MARSGHAFAAQKFWALKTRALNRGEDTMCREPLGGEKGFFIRTYAGLSASRRQQFVTARFSRLKQLKREEL